MQAIAGDTRPFQAVRELPGKEHVAEFAVAVGSESMPRRLTCDQILVRVEEVEVHRTQPMQQGGHIDDTAVLCLLQTVQQQQRQQKVAQVVDAECHAKTIFSSA